ncbi:hypothetical protein ACP4OV_001567 [Aristida adscensionis]
MANGRQSEVTIAVTNTMVGNARSADGNNHRDSMEELSMVTSNTGQESINGSSSRYLLGSRRESNVTADFELLWRLRKYLVLLGILAVSVTYNAGLTPPGGFWTKNIGGHDAADPVLRAHFFLRHEVFFYCNATAFAASLVLIILLLSKHVTRQKLWLRSMQFTMILDLFSLMGAYAAGSCRAVKSSIYIWVIVFAVFIYIMIHILVFIRVVPKFVSEKRFVPKCLKEKAESVQLWILSKCQRSSHQDKEVEKAPQGKDVEEARKFILMLVTFAATVTYQAGLSPPGGFWAENKTNKIPATSVLRSKNLARYNTFVSCNSTSFVASLVTIILLLSPELSWHGIRSKALLVCVIVDLLGLVGAYAAGSCRNVATSVFVVSITAVVWICFALLVGLFVHKPVVDWLEKIRPDIMKCMHTIGRAFSLEHGRNGSRNRDERNSMGNHRHAGCVPNSTQPESASESQHVPACHQQVIIIKEGESHEEDQTAHKQQNANIEEVVSSSEHVLVNDKQAENTNNIMYNLEDQSTDENGSAKDAMYKKENLQLVSTREQSSLLGDLKAKNSIDATSNPEHEFADSEQVAGQSSSSDGHKPTIMPVDLSEDKMVARGCNGVTNDLTAEQEHSDVPREAFANDITETNNDTRSSENGIIDRNEGCFKQDDSNKNDGANTTDKHLKKSRTYLLLLAILAVSLTYQSGLNPPGGFWSKREENNLTGPLIRKDTHHRTYHLPGDPILEDTHHRRYIAFFYLNAIAFVASLIMIIMLPNRRMSNKVIKRYALQIAMIVDLLALTGSYVMGSCRKKRNSIYISMFVFVVLVYVVVHVLIAMHVIPERCKRFMADKLENFSCRYIWPELPQFGHNHRGDNIEKSWERRRNLLLMLAVLAATVTYQAGMNPPGGVWSDDMGVSGNPGDPILQDNDFKRYDLFYFTNSLSFVSSVVITILLVNKESCEHGIKFYALRVCLMVGLIGLLIAYSAGSCRKTKQAIYLIIIAVAVLMSLLIQVLLLSSTDDTLGPIGNLIAYFLELLFGKEQARQETSSKQPELSGHLEPSSLEEARQETTQQQELSDRHEPFVEEARQEATSKKQQHSGNSEKKVRKRHKYLILLAILAASISYQAGLNPPGGIWSDDDDDGHVAGNPVLLDINPWRYKIFFWFNSVSLMTSIVVIMFLLNKSVWKKVVPLGILHLLMVLDLVSLMTAFAAGSCRKFRTSVYVYALVVGVLVYLVIVLLLSSSIAKCLRPGGRTGFSPKKLRNGVSRTESLINEQQV